MRPRARDVFKVWKQSVVNKEQKSMEWGCNQVTMPGTGTHEGAGCVLQGRSAGLLKGAKPIEYPMQSQVVVINGSQTLGKGNDGPLCFALVRYYLHCGDRLWAPSLDKGKDRSGAPEEHWTGMNHVLVTVVLPKLWLANWPVLGKRQLREAHKKDRGGGMLMSYRQVPQI